MNSLLSSLDGVWNTPISVRPASRSRRISAAYMTSRSKQMLGSTFSMADSMDETRPMLELPTARRMRPLMAWGSRNVPMKSASRCCSGAVASTNLRPSRVVSTLRPLRLNSMTPSISSTSRTRAEIALCVVCR
ncbi:Uncharacterised protein [Bordetella pertussis]|nr:Uncharacterised protein [Bordetella pertussis]CPK65650.1 Uncharacterised protein [Bordetella pertussis]CPM29948.1 Uncharacterised protein [Bordetella pertussis]